MQPIRPRESVILAEDFKVLVFWYREVLGFELKRLAEDDYHFANLETKSGIKIGIGSAKQMGLEPGDRSKAAVILQLEVDDLPQFFEHVAASGANILFGPTKDTEENFWFGAITDPEGNQWWVVDKDCP